MLERMSARDRSAHRRQMGALGSPGNAGRAYATAQSIVSGRRQGNRNTARSFIARANRNGSG